ncbi:MAG: CoA-transferase, partial [Bacillota bacterium]|nr:CoA-transferase [Bacillota bacterium]
LVDVGFLGGLEVDQYGNVNTTAVTLPGGGIRHFTGSGGANDIASLARSTVIVMRHEKRKFPARVSYLTSPGFLTGGTAREEAGLKGGGPVRVITDLGVLGFDPSSRRMELLALHPGVTWQEVQENTGFSLGEPRPLPTTAEPSPDELRLLREAIDPMRVYIR